MVNSVHTREVAMRYLEAGLAFTRTTRERAEKVVRDLVQAGEIRQDAAQEWVEELMTRSRHNSEAALASIRDEVSRQLSARGLATREEVERLVARLIDAARGVGRQGAGARKATSKAGRGTPSAKRTASQRPSKSKVSSAGKAGKSVKKAATSTSKAATSAKKAGAGKRKATKTTK